MKIVIDRAIVEQALEALEYEHRSPRGYGYELSVYEMRETSAAITALRAALAQQDEPVQEPVAWMFELARNFNLEGYGGWEKRITEYRPNTPEGSVRNVTPLYTAPPQHKN